MARLQADGYVVSRARWASFRFRQPAHSTRITVAALTRASKPSPGRGTVAGGPTARRSATPPQPIHGDGPLGEPPGAFITGPVRLFGAAEAAEATGNAQAPQIQQSAEAVPFRQGSPGLQASQRWLPGSARVSGHDRSPAARGRDWLTAVCRWAAAARAARPARRLLGLAQFGDRGGQRDEVRHQRGRVSVVSPVMFPAMAISRAAGRSWSPSWLRRGHAARTGRGPRGRRLSAARRSCRVAQRPRRDVQRVRRRPGRVGRRGRIAPGAAPDVLRGRSGLAGRVLVDRVPFRCSEPERPGTLRRAAGAAVPAAAQPRQGQPGRQPPAAVPHAAPRPGRCGRAG